MADDLDRIHPADREDLYQSQEVPQPERNIQQRPKVSLEQLAGILEGIWSSLDRIASALETIRPEVNVETPPAQVTVLREPDKVTRIIRNEKNQIVSAISETKEK